MNTVQMLFVIAGAWFVAMGLMRIIRWLDGER